MNVRTSCGVGMCEPRGWLLCEPRGKLPVCEPSGFVCDITAEMSICGRGPCRRWNSMEPVRTS